MSSIPQKSSSSSCVYTTQGNLLCGAENKGRDAFIQTQFRTGCLAQKEMFAQQQQHKLQQQQQPLHQQQNIYGNPNMHQKPKEKFANGSFAMDQLNTAFKSVISPARATGMENFASVPGKNTMNVTDDITGTYGLPWAPY